MSGIIEKKERIHVRIPESLLSRLDEEVLISGGVLSRNALIVKALTHLLDRQDQETEILRALRDTNAQLQHTTQRLNQVEAQIDKLTYTLDQKINAKIDHAMRQAQEKLKGSK